MIKFRKTMLSPLSSTQQFEFTSGGRRHYDSDMSEAIPELDGLRNLDQQTISAIHKRYFPELFRYARYRLGNEMIAEDIAGEAFARLLETIVAGGGPHTNLRGWLMSTTSNLIYDHLRQHYAHPTENIPEDLDLKADSFGLVQDIEQIDRNHFLQEVLAKLTPDQQQVIALRFGNSYSLEETASMMDKNVNAIKALQFRAIAALRRHIGDSL
jgi:RNA polymerase sigma-70 factor (ECF subfamily)